MFSHKYRYLFILLLACYSYLNTLFSEVYKYYHIPGLWYELILFFFLLTLLIWEGNRFLGIWLQKLFHDTRRPAFFLVFFLSRTGEYLGGAGISKRKCQRASQASTRSSYENTFSFDLHLLSLNCRGAYHGSRAGQLIDDHSNYSPDYYQLNTG